MRAVRELAVVITSSRPESIAVGCPRSELPRDAATLERRAAGGLDSSLAGASVAGRSRGTATIVMFMEPTVRPAPALARITTCVPAGASGGAL